MKTILMMAAIGLLATNAAVAAEPVRPQVANLAPGQSLAVPLGSARKDDHRKRGAALWIIGGVAGAGALAAIIASGGGHHKETPVSP